MKNIDPTKYQSANVSGVRFRYHKTRKYKTRPDKYWAIYYWYDGKRKDEGVGWSSQGFTKGNAIDYLRELKNNHLTKRGPQTLKEMRGVEAAQRANEQVEAEEKEKQNITFKNFFYDVYFPLQQTNTKPESWRRAESHARIWLNPVLGHLPIKDIKSEQLEVLKKKMPKTGADQRISQFTTKKHTPKLQMIVTKGNPDDPENPDLFGNIDITSIEAISGSTKIVTIPWGFYKPLYRVKIPAGIKHGAKLRLVGMGKSIDGTNKGDMYLRVLIKNDI